MSAQRRPRHKQVAAVQCGQALIAILFIVGILAVALVYVLVSPAKESIARDKKTAAALAQAKAALIGYAAGVDLGVGASRPGDLPCPDRDNDGDADAVPVCSGAALGRLPWKTLGVPELRDGDGERLWYAVSANFKNNPRTACTAPGMAGCLNSDTRGTITVRAGNGTVINDGSNPDPYTPSGVIAVIIAPGRVVQRQGAGAPQDRSCTIGVNCDANERCTTSPATSTPKCNPGGYLDVITDVFGTEDNATFADGSSADGFVTGPILDANGDPIVNDQLITITYQDLMPLLERRVAKEVHNCLNSYAAASNERYPWAARWNLSAAGDYSSQQGDRFGRLPDTFAGTLLGLISPTDPVLAPIVNSVCALTPAVCMSNSWPASCGIIDPLTPVPYSQRPWWNNWKEHVLYGVAEAYQPAATVQVLPPSVTVPAAGCGNCLEVNPPSSANDKRFVVIVAGKRLSAVASGQPRSSLANKSDASNYVEDQNDGSATQNEYTRKPATATFNDVLLYYQ